MRPAARFAAIFALALLLPSVASAQNAPTSLDHPTGLAPTAPVGFAPESPDRVRDYVRSMTALELGASYLADKSGSKLPGVNIAGGAKVDLDAHFAKKDGVDSPVLDSLRLRADGVKLGPTALKRVDIRPNGEMDVKLGTLIPEVHIKRIERQSNGDTKLVTSGLMPNVTITKDGDVKLLGKTLGHVDTGFIPSSWPPSVEDVMKLGAHDPSTGGDSALTKLAGDVTWKGHVETRSAIVAVDGKPIRGDGKVDIAGHGRVAQGRFSTLGDDNTTKVTMDLGGQSIGDDQTGVFVKSGTATLDGHYRLDMPLQDAAKHMVVDFQGHAAYEGTLTDAHLSLPEGAKVRIAEVDVLRDGALRFHQEGDAKTFAVDPARFEAQIKGPIHVEKLGPIDSLDLDGKLTSSGVSTFEDGKLTVTGDLRGDGEATNGIVSLGTQGKPGTPVKAGSTVHVDMNKVDVTVDPKGASHGKLADGVTVEGTGKVSAHAGLGPVDLSAGSTRVTTAGATADGSFDGKVKVQGGTTTLAGDTKTRLTLDEDAALEVGKPTDPTHVKTTLGAGSHVDLEGKIAGMISPNATARVTAAKLNGRSGPGADNPVQRVFDRDQTLRVVSLRPGWVEVENDQGERSFVSADHVTISPVEGTFDGRVTGEVTAHDGEVKTGGVDSTIKGDAKIGLDAPVTGGMEAGGKRTFQPTKARLPMRVDLRAGTRVLINKAGAETSITLDQGGGYVQATGNVTFDQNGKPVLQSLDDADLLLSLGPAAAKLVGRSFDMPSQKTIAFKGRLVFRPNGLDVYGDLTVRVHGDANTPILKIDW